jgi:hypothetical protein
MNVHTGENPPMRGKESRNRNVVRLGKSSSELVNVFEEARRNFILFSIVTRQVENLKTLWRMYQRVPYLLGFKEIQQKWQWRESRIR